MNTAALLEDPPLIDPPLVDPPPDFEVLLPKPKRVIIPPSNIGKPLPHPGRKTALTQICRLQELLMKDANDPKTTATARAQVARAWEVLEERKRILRMKPKPRDLDMEKVALEKVRRKAQPTAKPFEEPEAPGQKQTTTT